MVVSGRGAYMGEVSGARRRRESLAPFGNHASHAFHDAVFLNVLPGGYASEGDFQVRDARVAWRWARCW